jgi:predicted N-acetyltransferase YhbS
MRAFSIQPLTLEAPWRAQMAAEQFATWGPLTGHDSAEAYEVFLEKAARSAALPRVLVATRAGALLGSVNLLAQEMAIRPQFTPWLGQLFVRNHCRAEGIGTALVDAAIAYAGVLGYGELFLFTSGSLPDYYRKRGWRDVETVDYLSRQRTVMRFDISVNR